MMGTKSSKTVFGPSLGRARCVTERWEEPIAVAWHRRDESRRPPVVLELCAQVADMAVNNVATGGMVGAPKRIQDLVARHYLTSMCRQQVEQALLEAREMKLRGPGSDLTLHDVDLDLAELQDRVERDRCAVAATGDAQHSSKQLLG